MEVCNEVWRWGLDLMKAGNDCTPSDRKDGGFGNMELMLLEYKELRTRHLTFNSVYIFLSRVYHSLWDNAVSFE